METNIVSNNQKESWNSFVIENNGSFLQSFEWGEFKERLGSKVFRIQAKDGNKVLAQALVIHHKLPFGLKSYFYIPYGPCFKNENALGLFFKGIKDLAKKQEVIFLRIEPQRDFDMSIFRNTDKVPSKGISALRVQPQKTLVLDIKGETDSILQGFPKATRYSIRTAEKKGVTVEFRDEYTSEFYELLLKTAGKSKFKPHEEAHYKRFFDVSSESFKVKMCLIRHRGTVISASIMIMFAKRATYLHAASDKAFSKMQAPTLLMWEQIKFAKQMGCEVFDFWGVDDVKWPGVTKFKKSFGGREVAYPQGEDIVFNKFLYTIYKLAKKMKG